MLRSPDRDPKVEFVADQLQQIGWISGYNFILGEGYYLEWLHVGSHRMTLLRIALRESKTAIHILDHLDTKDAVTHAAIRDFWEACISQIGIRGEDESLLAFVNIIESWEPQ